MIPPDSCAEIRSSIPDYLDGSLDGRRMQSMRRHIDACAACAAEFQEQESLLRALSSLGPVRGPRQAPRDLTLRIRVALEQERLVRLRSQLPARKIAWKLAWTNSIGPFLFQLSTGLASAVVLLGSVALMVGLFARPEKASAFDEPLGDASAPHLLYQLPAVANDDSIQNASTPVVVEAYINPDGLVYDYRIVSGPQDARTRSAVEDRLLFSIFEPARIFGKPVRGLAVISFADVAVHG